jgi:hydroxymethylbilane synthase
MKLRLGTRRSLMAMTQSGIVADALTARTGHEVELIGVTTEGDVSKANLAQIGGTGVFVNGLREKVLSGEVDFAVHSLKDLPTSPAEGIVLAAVPPRDDPRDALCGPAKLADLPRGARIGTGSPRRMAQLRGLRRDLEVVPIRGNADTRLRKVTDGEFDAIVLAYAGLVRINRLEAVSEVFDPGQMLPAPGQGALAVECRADDEAALARLARLEHAPSRRAVDAERAFLTAIGGGCDLPVGAYATVAADGRTLHLTGVLAALDGGRLVRREAAGPEPVALGQEVAAAVLAEGRDLLVRVDGGST